MRGHANSAAPPYDQHSQWTHRNQEGSRFRTQLGKLCLAAVPYWGVPPGGNHQELHATIRMEGFCQATRRMLGLGRGDIVIYHWRQIGLFKNTWLVLSQSSRAKYLENYKVMLEQGQESKVQGFKLLPWPVTESCNRDGGTAWHWLVKQQVWFVLRLQFCANHTELGRGEQIFLQKLVNEINHRMNPRLLKSDK